MAKKEEKKPKKKVDTHPVVSSKPTFGERAADKLTTWAGSWTFIIIFTLFLLAWMAANTIWLIFGRSWDSYPFILLNLVLSCVAALQAPVILMSQNRAAQKDRIRAEYDYQVNRKAERGIQNILKQLTRIERKMTVKKTTKKK